MTFESYQKLSAVNWSTLKNMKRSPLHYKHGLENSRPDTPRLAVGRAVHTAVFEPAMMKSQARSAGAQGKTHFQWGYSFDPSASDPRRIQFLVHVQNGKPAAIEMIVQLRKFDGTADEVRSVRFPWPTA